MRACVCVCACVYMRMYVHVCVCVCVYYVCIVVFHLYSDRKQGSGYLVVTILLLESKFWVTFMACNDPQRPDNIQRVALKEQIFVGHC